VTSFREVAPEPVNDFEDIEDATVGDILEETDHSMFEAEEAPAPVAPVATKITGPEFTFEQMLGSVRQTAEVSAEPAPIARVAPTRTITPVPEIPMQSARYAQTALTDEHTADVAAGALGKLISKMEIAGDNTIEGLVREMLKPMIKEWLDANLAGIVEEKVEAEVQRIARMAR
jgi:cell pole-organizing protein PopZ